MFLYYALHSTINQLRKFVRTWAFILLLVVAVLGGVAWYAVRWYAERLRETNALMPEDVPELLATSGLTALNALELVVGLLVLGVLLLQVIGAEKSTSRLFLPADAHILFPSPRSPQEILAFRVASTLSLAIAVAPVMLVRIPSIMEDWGVGLYAALTFPLAWCFTLGFSSLFKILAFELGSRHRFLRQNLRWFVLGALGLCGVLFYHEFDSSVERNLLTTAQIMLNAPWTRAVPVWGWIKGMVACAFEGRIGASVSLLALNLLLMALLTWGAAHVRADYYEETLSWTEESARFRDELASDNAALVILEISQRGSKRGAQGFARGFGASVYFFKVLHQRRRFSRFGFVTKTMMTYLFAAAAAGLFTKHFMDEALPYVPALLLAAMVFFRTVISPVTEDVRKDSFLLLPEPIGAKLFFSLAGGACNCALDVAVPLIVGSAAAGFMPLEGLVYLPALVSADFFASSSGVFADISIPPSIGVNLKQVAKVLLLYIGLIFDGMVLTYGIGVGNDAVGFALASVLNLLFGGTFLGLAGVWLRPRHGRPARQEAIACDVADARRTYARVGFALAGMYVAVHGGQRLLSLWVPPLVATYLPIYGLGLPVFLMLVGKGGTRPASRPLKVLEVLALLPTCLFVAYVGNILGYGLQWVLDALITVDLLPEVAGPGVGFLGLQMALVTVASPVMEEVVFRRCLIDRLQVHGQRTALVVSALAFGLFHGTANQLCYGALIGLVFGYVYMRTGRLRYSMGVHMAINVLSSLVLPALLLQASNALPSEDAGQVLLSSVILRPEVLALVGYVALLCILALLGMVLFAYGVSERRVLPGGIGIRDALTTWGMVAFLALSIVALL